MPNLKLTENFKFIACEESQTICKEFRAKGHTAFSCDILSCSGGHPEWHIKSDCLPLLGGNCHSVTEDGHQYQINGKWDLLIAHPPCTYLTVSGNRWFSVEKYGDKALQRIKDREDAVNFFMRFVNADCDKIAIENPIGVISTVYRKADQIIQPWMFGDNETKSTCLWLKNLPLLVPSVTEKPEIEYKEWTDKDGKKKRQSLWYFNALAKAKSNEERRTLRSKTFKGIAEAIANQWSE